MLYKCLLSRLLLWTALNLQTFFAVKMPPLKDFVYRKNIVVYDWFVFSQMHFPTVYFA